MADRISIIIDGSNFYFKLKDLNLRNQLRFNFKHFISELSGQHDCISCKYYIGGVKTDGTQRLHKLHSQQQRILKYIQLQGLQYSLGYLMKVKNKYHEKGVDVQMATDMLITAYENKADKIYLISSDTDLIPAISQAQKLKKHVKYIGFAHKPSKALMDRCDSYHLLEKSYLMTLFHDQQTH